MRFDPLLPVPAIAVAATLLGGFVIARAVRAGLTVAVARGALMAVLGLAIVADPAVAGGASDARRVAADVVFVVDSTSSMAAVDYADGEQRLAGVRADILDLAAAFPGANFTLIRFDSQARLELPWTTDVTALKTAVSVIRQERAVYSQGSRLDLPLAVLDELVPRPGRVRSGSGNDDSYVVVFYFSDGEQRALPRGDRPSVDTQTGMILAQNDGTEEPATTFRDLAADVDGGAVFGYGTSAGAPMIEFRGRNDELFVGGLMPYVIDYSTNVPAISRLDEGNLTDIADDLGVPYLHRSEPGGLEGLASALADDAPVVSDGSRETLDRLYWIPALGLLALVVWQAAVTATELRSTRRLLASAPKPPSQSHEQVSPARTRRPAAPQQEPAA